jgi:hypothetical protein
MAAAIRGRVISASELLSITFQRIDLHNPKLNAIVWQDREQAIARAKGADAALAKGDASGALHGVPVTIKESFAYRGSPNTWGLPSLEHAKSPRTAVAVQRLNCRRHRHPEDQRSGDARRLAKLQPDLGRPTIRGDLTNRGWAHRRQRCGTRGRT